MTNLKISRSPSLSVAFLAAGLLVACGIEPDEIDAADTAEEQAADEDGSGTGEGDGNEGVGDGDGDGDTGDGDGDDSGDGDGDSGDGDGDTGDGDGDTGNGDGDGDTGDGDGDGDGETGDGDGDGDQVCGDLECNACYQCARDDQSACADEKAACEADPGCVEVSECQYWCGSPYDPEFEGCMEFCAEGKPGGELFEDLVECLACDVCSCPDYFQCQ